MAPFNSDNHVGTGKANKYKSGHDRIRHPNIRASHEDSQGVFLDYIYGIMHQAYRVRRMRRSST